MPRLDVQSQLDILDFYYKSFRDDVALATGQDISDSEISEKAPLEISDLDGSELFRDYAIVNPDGQKIGALRSSARGAEIPLIDAVFIGKLLFDEATVEKEIIELAVADFPGTTFTTKGFVCYGYPRNRCPSAGKE